MQDQAGEHVQQATSGGQQANATQATRQKAQELGVELNQVQDSGAQGCLTVRDVIVTALQRDRSGAA